MSRRFAQLLCLGPTLKLPSGALDLMLDDPISFRGSLSSSSLDVVEYSGRGDPCPCHVDKGLLTVIVCPSGCSEALRVRLPGGPATTVALAPGSAAVLPGWELEVLTGGRVRASEHWLDPAALAQEPGRMAFCFKLRCNLQVRVGCSSWLRRHCLPC